ncbi:MAG: thioredoxin-disulfide reductase [Clostridiales bacterium]|nr:thioredoxin-disulfide reductase [Clostridiales bacterium]
MPMLYDVIILGAGPAGLSAALYAGRACLKTLLIEKAMPGGQITLTSDIENYPGQLLEGESGFTLTERMNQQADKFGVEHIYDEITAVDFAGAEKVLTGVSGEYRARAVIIATGAHPRPIGCENEAAFTGRGISYCATCDGAFFRDLPVYVVGGGDSAVEEAIYLTRFAREVTIIHRREKLRAVKGIQEKAFANGKIRFLWNTVVERVDGDTALSEMTLRNVVNGETTLIRADEADGLFGLFGFVGYAPNSALFEGKLEMEHGYIITDEDMRTSIPGVFAAGDVRKKSLRQVITAAADGAIAAMQAARLLEE